MDSEVWVWWLRIAACGKRSASCKVTFDAPTLAGWEGDVPSNILIEVGPALPADFFPLRSAEHLTEPNVCTEPQDPLRIVLTPLDVIEPPV